VGCGGVTRRSAGPTVLLSRSGQPGGNGIVLDVMLDALKFIGIANRMIVALVLPKRLTCPMQDQVRTSDSPQPTGQYHLF
jgi:hypothetical protein